MDPHKINCKTAHTLVPAWPLFCQPIPEELQFTCFALIGPLSVPFIPLNCCMLAMSLLPRRTGRGKKKEKNPKFPFRTQKRPTSLFYSYKQDIALYIYIDSRTVILSGPAMGTSIFEESYKSILDFVGKKSFFPIFC